MVCSSASRTARVLFVSTPVCVAIWLTSPDFDNACDTGFIAAGFLADFAAGFFFIAMDQISPASFLMGGHCTAALSSAAGEAYLGFG